jgi:hypothetical protein
MELFYDEIKGGLHFENASFNSEYFIVLSPILKPSHVVSDECEIWTLDAGEY